MVRITPSSDFIKSIKKLDLSQKERIEKQIIKIIDNPEVGKPLKYKRGERSLYIKPFRLIYAVRGNEIVLLKFDHRKDVYKS
jgi:mRNA-degrading endonuclease RelE of RelBE toxin-antitoxin system